MAALRTALPDKRSIVQAFRAVSPDERPISTFGVKLIAQEGRGYMLFDPDGLIHESLLESSIELEVKTPTGRQTQRVQTRSVQILEEVRETPGSDDEDD